MLVSQVAEPRHDWSDVDDWYWTFVAAMNGCWWVEELGEC